jgi:hypothetical protein
MSSPNPGISAAGEAAGRTALNPATGPAAIGGMLVPGPEPSAFAVSLQNRLSTAVSDVTKLLKVLRELSLNLNRGGSPTEEPQWERSASGGETSPSLPNTGPAAGNAHTNAHTNGGNDPRRGYGLGATAAVTTDVLGYRPNTIEAGDLHHPQASHHYRM